MAVYTASSVVSTQRELPDRFHNHDVRPRSALRETTSPRTQRVHGDAIAQNDVAREGRRDRVCRLPNLKTRATTKPVSTRNKARRQASTPVTAKFRVSSSRVSVSSQKSPSTAQKCSEPPQRKTPRGDAPATSFEVTRYRRSGAVLVSVVSKAAAKMRSDRSRNTAQVAAERVAGKASPALTECIAERLAIGTSRVRR